LLRFAVALLALAALSGCSSIPVGSGPPQRMLDTRSDLTTLVLAFDLPRGVEPVERSSILSFDAGPAEGGRHLELGLVRVDAGDVTDILPPPGSQRVYYLLGFAEAGKAALRDAQAWARAEGITPTVALAPRFCHVTALDPAAVSVAVLGVLPGETAPSVVLERQVLADVLQATGGEFANCA
jgi:hypothetical protein